MRVGIMIEAQRGLNWPRWKRIGWAVEDLGFVGLWRSDHFVSSDGTFEDALELWVSLAWLADNTSRIEFGPLVTPVSFRHPVWTARMGKDVDDLSGGRLVLGVGTGWQEQEHRMFGFELLPLRERFARFEEGLEVITRLLRSDEPVTFHGRYFRLEGAMLMPRPSRPGGPPILVGGNGRRRTLPLAARYADEWNGLFIPPAQYAELNRYLDTLLQDIGRRPEDVRRSVMTGLVFGRTERELQEKLRGRDAAALRERGIVVGTPTQVADQVRAFLDAGAERVILQWLDLDDMDGLEALARSVENV